jgi:predicted nuclease of predicted toxin-antitoxin system
MRLLADESCDFAVVRALRASGHDVLSVAEISPRAEDTDVVALTIRENRVLITEDKDFGQLVYADKRASGGVLFLRFPARSRRTLPQTVVNLVNKEGERLIGAFVVIQPGRTRVGRSPM